MKLQGLSNGAELSFGSCRDELKRGCPSLMSRLVEGQSCNRIRAEDRVVPDKAVLIPAAQPIISRCGSLVGLVPGDEGLHQASGPLQLASAHVEMN